jgi:hypothetical protein
VAPSRSTVVGEAATNRARSTACRIARARSHDGGEATARGAPALQVAVLGRETLVRRAQLLHQALVLGGQLAIVAPEVNGLDGMADHGAQLARIEGLRDVAHHTAEVDRTDQRLHVRVAGQDDRDQPRADLARARDHLEPAHAGHALVRDQDRHVVLAHECERLCSPQRGMQGELAIVVQPDDLEDVGLVIDDEDRVRAMIHRRLHRGRQCIQP